MSEFKTKLKTIGNNISTGFHSANDFCVESLGGIKSRFSSYFESKDFEIDLDSIIDAIHAHTEKRPNFEPSEDFKARIKQKRDYLLKQAAMLVGAAALKGAWFAIESNNPSMAGEYALVAACGTVLIIVVSATGVILKRVLKDYDVEFSKTSQFTPIFES